MSTPRLTESKSNTALSSTAVESSSNSSTRESILARYGRSKATDGGDAAGGGVVVGAGRSRMECFESAEPNESATAGAAGQTSAGGLRGSAAKKSSSSSTNAAIHSEDVDTSANRPKLAFQTFAGALYRGGPTHGVFESGSDILVAGSKSSNGVASPSPDSAAFSTRFESPFVRLNRLQTELKEFHSDLTAAAAQQTKTAADADGKDDAWTNLSTNVAQLQGQLDSILSQPQYASLLNGVADNSKSSASAASLLPQFDTLFSQYVTALQANPNFKPVIESPVAVAPSPSTSADLTVLPKLDERLATVEKFIGLNGSATAATKPGSLLAFNPNPAASTNPTAPTTTISVLPAPDLLSALSSLHTQLAALNPQRLEFIGRTIKAILLEQETLQLNAKQSKEENTSGLTSSKSVASEKKDDSAAAASAPAYAAQVAHLYSLTSRWDSLALGLPSLIQRLTSLHTLHAASATLQSQVSLLESNTNSIDSAIRSQTEGMIAIQKAASENMNQMKENFHAMEKRMEELTKKMNQIRK